MADSDFLVNSSVAPTFPFQYCFENALIGIAFVSFQKGWLQVNRRFVQMLGYQERELDNIGWMQLFHPDDRELEAEALDRLIDERTFHYTGERRLLRKDGSYFSVILSVNAGVQQGEGVDSFVAFIQDVSERKKAEASLRHIDERLHSIISTAPIILWMINEKAQLTFAEGKGLELLNPSIPGLFEHSVYEVFSEDPDFLSLILAAMNDKKYHDTVSIGSGFFETWFHHIVDDQGISSGMTGISLDITKRHRAETEKERLIEQLQRKNEDLERFTYTVSHDLKSPLITIKGFLGLLRDSIAENNQEQVSADLERIDHAVNTMHRLLDELLILSRIERSDTILEPVDLNHVLADALELLSGSIRENGVEVLISSKLPIIQGYRCRLIPLFQNVLDNAIKSCSYQENPLLQIASEKLGDSYQILIRDNGLGMESSEISQAFDLFSELESDIQGSGVGLTIVKRMMELHGGRVELFSEGKGKGTTVLLYFPEKFLGDI